ncbi:MAG TPA: phospholipase D-like domain-containing protein, partial [Nitrososphaera sp.]|nr:phospholipase D-like domain-containing protein [Nitrososphaera sp.]
LSVRLSYRSFKEVEIGFTRGYVSSQAYAEHFDNSEIEPAKRPLLYDTGAYQKKYRWLGAHARRLVFYFLKEVEENPSLRLDMFAFDFDEPDIVRAIAHIGPRANLFLDDHDLGPKKLAKAAKLKQDAIDELKDHDVKIKLGHFTRFQHNKVMIQIDGSGKPTKVLTGSANFSLRGLYVQANSVLVFDDDRVAALYEEAYREAFNGVSKYKKSHIASRWHLVERNENTPAMWISFAPHEDAFTLDKVSDAIRSANSSVLFSIMGMGGGGPVIPSIKQLLGEDNIFSLGSTQTSSGLELFRPGLDNNQAIVPYSYLKDKVPAPFRKEWSGGAGMSIHHKYVVCDFNDSMPVVFCGSSNLAEGGEKGNGDNLIAIYDKNIATLYAIEAIRLFDHYRFRSVQQTSTANRPLVLADSDKWVDRYYDPKNIKYLERSMLCKH